MVKILNKKNFDNLFFSLVVLCSLLLSINGKTWSAYLFDNSTLYFQKEYMKFGVYLTVVASVFIFYYIRKNSIAIKIKGLLCVFTGFSASFLILIQSDIPSPLIFFLHIGIFLVTTGVIAIEPYLQMNMKSEFWKIIFESCIKLLQFSLVGIAIIITVLRVFHTNGASGFISTLSYPLLVFIIQYFVIAYWIMLPCWNKLTDSYKA